MSIVNETFFQKGELHIPNNRDMGARSTNQTATNTSELIVFIDKYERLLLINALGVNLYNDIEDALTKKPFDASSSEDADQKFIDLINGKDYVFGSKKYRWEGLKGFKNDSLIAYYIKSIFLANKESVFTTEGIVKLEPSNGSSFSMNRQFSSVYNQFCYAYQGRHVSRAIRRSTVSSSYLDNKHINVCLKSYKRNTIVSLYEYLNDQSDFKDFDFKFYRPANVMGI